MSARPLLALTVPVLAVLALCMYLKQRASQEAARSASSGQGTEQPAEPTAQQPSPAEDTQQRGTTRQPAECTQPADTDIAGDSVQEEVARAEGSHVQQSAAPPPPPVPEASLDTADPAGQPAAAAADLSSAADDTEPAVEPEMVAERQAGLLDTAPGADSGVPPAEAAVSGGADSAPEVSVVTALEAQVVPPGPAGDTEAGEAAGQEQKEQAAAGDAADGTAQPDNSAEQGSGEVPAAPDNVSEKSSDSGKGGSSASLDPAGSPSQTPQSGPAVLYDFLIPQKLCGRLIGKGGSYVNQLRAKTGANVVIRFHPVRQSVKVCSIEGTQAQVDACLVMIRDKFPIRTFPRMTLERINKTPEQLLAVPDSQQLHLPQGVTCDVLVSAVVSAGHVFLQQHTHPTFRGLERLGALMLTCYGSGQETPPLPRPVQAGSICAAAVEGGWYRAQVCAFYPDSDEVDVRFMDYGGYSRLSAGDCRQIRTDFMSLPFQTAECYLANVTPPNDESWSAESGAVLEELITGRALEAMVVGFAPDGIPFINLYSIQGTEYGNAAISFVNQQLVELGAARWMESQA